MTRFIQLHLLTSYPPSNLNRDDMGRPKTAVMGGKQRLRVSSQSLKRAWRTSDVFKAALDAHVGTRTRMLGVEVYNHMIKEGLNKKTAFNSAKAIAGVFGKNKSKDSKKDKATQELEIEQLVHVSPSEREAVMTLGKTLVGEDREPTADELKLLRQDDMAADIAMFGRMLAASTDYNVEAAVQVAHAITTHEVKVEDDFFSAVDDLNDLAKDTGAGAGHIGEAEFGAGIFYLYVCIDRQALIENLNGNTELADKAIEALIKASATVSPTGKQNSFASRAWASYMLAERGDAQPRSLSVAFIKSVRHEDPLAASIKALNTTRDNIDKVYGDITPSYAFNAHTGEGSLEALASFVKDGGQDA